MDNSQISTLQILFFSFYAIKYSKKKLHLVQFKDYPQISTFRISSYVSFCNSNILKKRACGPIQGLSPTFTNSNILYFSLSTILNALKKKGKNIQSLSQLSAVQIFPPPFSAVESNIGLLRKQAIGKSNETKKYYTTI